MSYGSPTSNPAVADYRAFLVSPDGVQVTVNVGPIDGGTEMERDATFQAAIDALEGLGWTYNGGTKSYGTTEDITVTP